MSTYSKAKLSGSTDGKGIKVVATAIGSGTTIHTAAATGPDNITLYVTNSDTVSRLLTLGWGGTASPDDLIAVPVPPKAGLMLVTANLPLQNSLIVKAACDAANVLVIFGSVNLIS